MILWEEENTQSKRVLSLATKRLSDVTFDEVPIVTVILISQQPSLPTLSAKTDNLFKRLQASRVALPHAHSHRKRRGLSGGSPYPLFKAKEE